MLSASHKANFLWMLLPLSLVTLHIFMGERTAYSLTPDLDVVLNTEQTSLRQERQVKFQVALVFQNRERAAISEVMLSVRGPRGFDTNLPLVEGEFDLSGIHAVVGTLMGTVRTNAVATPLPSLYKSSSTGGTILIDAVWNPGDDATVDGSYVAQVVIKLEDASNPLKSEQIEFALLQPTPTSTTTPTATSTPTSTPTATNTPTRTPKPTRTKTPTPTKTAIPKSTPTATYTPTPIPTDTVKPTATLTPTHTAVPIMLLTPSVVDTPALTHTPTAIYAPQPATTSTIVAQAATSTPTASLTPTPVNVPTSTPTSARLALIVDSAPASNARLPSSQSFAGRLVKSSSVRIFAADPSKPLVLIVDDYTVSNSTPSTILAPNPNIETADVPADALAHYSDPYFIVFSAGLALAALTALALLRSRQGIG